MKSSDTNSNRAIEELKLNFKVVEIVSSDKLVESFVKHEYLPTEIQSPLTKTIIYEFKTYNKEKIVPCCSCIY